MVPPSQLGMCNETVPSISSRSRLWAVQTAVLGRVVACCRGWHITASKITAVGFMPSCYKPHRQLEPTFGAFQQGSERHVGSRNWKAIDRTAVAGRWGVVIRRPSWWLSLVVSNGVLWRATPGIAGGKQPTEPPPLSWSRLIRWARLWRAVASA